MVKKRNLQVEPLEVTPNRKRGRQRRSETNHLLKELPGLEIGHAMKEKLF